MIDRLFSGLPLILLLLALLAALSFWLSQSVRTPSPAQDNEIGRTPDYRVENFSAIRMDQDGLARHMLVAKEMVHYPDDDTTDLEQPLFINTEPGKPALQIKADKAKMSSNNKDIYLTGNVMVLRNAAKGRSESTMTTSLLHLIPDDDIAKTDKPVVITEKKSVIKAVGMEMNSRTNIIQLFSRVRVIHDTAR
jgi:lipopolysaccharide export system protein LptC